MEKAGIKFLNVKESDDIISVIFVMYYFIFNLSKVYLLLMVV